MSIKAYKGFGKDMKCKGYQYEEGKEYTEKRAVLCKSGFHACERPLDVFAYYPPASSVYHHVEMDDESEERTSDDTKLCAKKIRIGARLSIGELVKAQVEYVKEHCTTEHTNPEYATAGDRGAATAGDSGAATAGYRGAATAGDSGAATAGDRGAATAGDSGAATAGDSGAATAGDSGAATAGYRGAATAGNFGAATAGDRGAATAGDSGAATAGYRGAATAGYFGAATSRGKSAVGENGLAVARGNNVRAKGGMGAVIFLAEEEDDSYDLIAWKAGVIDGVTLKPDTWYKLENGEFVEAEEDGEV